MQIMINGQTQELPTEQNLKDFVSTYKSYSRWCAIAVNGQFVPKQSYESTYLKAGDRVEVLPTCARRIKWEKSSIKTA